MKALRTLGAIVLLIADVVVAYEYFAGSLQGSLLGKILVLAVAGASVLFTRTFYPELIKDWNR